MLFQALTGRMPLAGSLMELLQRKQEVDSPPPSEVSPGVPHDLDALCVELLRRDPALRPGGAEVLRRLHAAEAAAAPSPVPSLPTVSRSPFIGRAAHLRTLAGALETVRGGRTAVVYVSGSSGVGKTALVREFLARMEGRQETVLLQGKCHERESIPYKALDSVAESLAQYLVRLPLHEVGVAAAPRRGCPGAGLSDFSAGGGHRRRAAARNPGAGPAGTSPAGIQRAARAAGQAGRPENARPAR